MSSQIGFGVNKHQSEVMHKTMFALHWAIYRDALGTLAAGLDILHKQEGHVDCRQSIRGYIAKLEAIRDTLERAGEDAAALRSQLIHENGCDGSCG